MSRGKGQAQEKRKEVKTMYQLQDHPAIARAMRFGYPASNEPDYSDIYDDIEYMTTAFRTTLKAIAENPTISDEQYVQIDNEVEDILEELLGIEPEDFDDNRWEYEAALAGLKKIC
jgi:hypothetical protein